jgi:hypothetical protein
MKDHLNITKGILTYLKYVLKNRNRLVLMSKEEEEKKKKSRSEH